MTKSTKEIRPAVCALSFTLYQLSKSLSGTETVTEKTELSDHIARIVDKNFPPLTFFRFS